MTPELPRRAILTDLTLHDALSTGLGNPLAAAAYAVNRDRIAVIQNTRPFLPDRIVPAMREHLAIIDALERRDAEAAVAAIDAHYRTTLRWWGSSSSPETPGQLLLELLGVEVQQVAEQLLEHAHLAAAGVGGAGGEVDDAPVLEPVAGDAAHHAVLVELDREHGAVDHPRRVPGEVLDRALHVVPGRVAQHAARGRPAEDLLDAAGVVEPGSDARDVGLAAAYSRAPAPSGRSRWRGRRRRSAQPRRTAAISGASAPLGRQRIPLLPYRRHGLNSRNLGQAAGSRPRGADDARPHPPLPRQSRLRPRDRAPAAPRPRGVRLRDRADRGGGGGAGAAARRDRGAADAPRRAAGAGRRRRLAARRPARRDGGAALRRHARAGDDADRPAGAPGLAARDRAAGAPRSCWRPTPRTSRSRSATASTSASSRPRRWRSRVPAYPRKPGAALRPDRRPRPTTTGRGRSRRWRRCAGNSVTAVEKIASRGLAPPRAIAMVRAPFSGPDRRPWA